MIPVILDKRKFPVRSGRIFNKLIAYVEGDAGEVKYQTISEDQKFNNILSYTTCQKDNRIGLEKCLAIRTHGVTDITSATIEMNAVAARNTRCKDPGFHFVLAWPEHERPTSDAIFDAAEHAILSLGLADHQYVLAIHVNTDNIHCHAAVNCIHPDTYRSHNIEWANRTIHMAARQSEIKHGWTHENGIYIVKIDDENSKSIILNPDHDYTSHNYRRTGNTKTVLPTWHDPDSLDSWLKFTVAKALKSALPTFTNWYALHAWLANNGITLTDSGGGGMRLHATSQMTGEVIDLPASKGLRILKRAELENRWGKFTNEKLLASNVPELSEFSQSNSKWEARRDQRAIDRADLRRRFSQYRRIVSEGDIDYFKRTSEIRSERNESIKLINKDTKTAILASSRKFPVTEEGCLPRAAAILTEGTRRKHKVEINYRDKFQSLRAIRLPPLVWREWLYEQAKMGDQVAISALRGIVYQAKRDAKHRDRDVPVPVEVNTFEYPELQYQKAMANLLEEERREVAIRSAKSNSMRPYEIDALLVKHNGMQWHVTGNGNIAYYNWNSEHLFTDRGNRVTFDRVLVSDDDIRLAFVHSQQKFGNQLTLTGSDPIFIARMACLADDMGMTVLNPDVQQVITNHRNKRAIKNTEVQSPQSASNEQHPPSEPAIQSDYSAQQENFRQVSELTVQLDMTSDQGHLRALVLTIDPRAKFLIPDISDSQQIYYGLVAATFTDEDPVQGFAQHLGRSIYALHSINAPVHHNSASIEIQYREGLAVAKAIDVSKGQKGKAR